MILEEALAWAILHFLWQGAVIGLLTMVGIWTARRPQVRYVIGVTGLAVMAVAFVSTLLWLWRDPGYADWKVSMHGTPTVLDLVLPWVNRLWAAGTSILLLRAAGGWWLARGLTQRQIKPLCEDWARRASAMMRRMTIPARVRIVESASVTVPMVFGFLWPVVLLPTCALTGMTVAQVEALLAHEFAHVRRHDYLVNLIQTLLEAALFYHPAVWMVSANVRRMRELCCDEVAVEVCGDRMAYTAALLRMEETRSALVMAAGGGSLKERIGRLLGMNEKRQGWTPVWLMGGVLMICMGVAWARSAQAPPPPPPPPPPAAPDAPANVSMLKVEKGKPAPDAPPPPPPPPPPGGKVELDEARDRVEMEAAQAEIERVKAKIEHQRHQIQKARQEFATQSDLNDRQRKEKQQQIEAMMALVDAQRAELERRAHQIRSKGAAMAHAHSVATEDEIERRIKYAEARFSSPGVNGLLSDRGRQYLKLGPPDEIEAHAGQKEIWRYRSGDKVRTVEFDGAGKLKK